MSRTLSFSSCVRRRTSLIFLIDTLFVAIGAPLSLLTAASDLLIQMSAGALLNACHQLSAITGTLSAITGTLSAMRRNRCPRWGGICINEPNSELSEQETARARALGLPEALTITYDLDRDGRDERIHIYSQRPQGLSVWVDLEIDDVRLRLDDDCRGQDAEPDQVEIALRDVNGDRKPEIWIAWGAIWGQFCVLEYRGISDWPRLRRGPDSLHEAGKQAFRKLLEGPSGFSVSVGHDTSIEVCGGTGCHTSWKYNLAGRRLFKVVDSSEQLPRPVPYLAKDNDEPIRSLNPASIERRVTALLAKYHQSTDPHELASLFTATVVTEKGVKRGREQAQGTVDYYQLLHNRSLSVVPGTLRVRSESAAVYIVEFKFSYTATFKKDGVTRSGEGNRRMKTIELGDGSLLIAETFETITLRCRIQGGSRECVKP